MAGDCCYLGIGLGLLSFGESFTHTCLVVDVGCCLGPELEFSATAPTWSLCVAGGFLAA